MSGSFRALIVLALSLVATAPLHADVFLGQVAPDFHLQDQFGNFRELKDFHGKWLLVYFYPKDGTSGCTTEAERFRDLYPVLQSHQLNIVGISEDNLRAHAHFAHELQLPFSILVDAQGKVAKNYGVLNNLLVTRFASRQSFLIDPHGVVLRHYTHVDPTRHATEVLHDLVHLQGGS